MTGIEVNLGNGKHLFVGHVPTRKRAGVGIREGGTLNILGWFIGEAEHEKFRDELKAAFDQDRWVLALGPIPTDK